VALCARRGGGEKLGCGAFRSGGGGGVREGGGGGGGPGDEGEKGASVVWVGGGGGVGACGWGGLWEEGVELVGGGVGGGWGCVAMRERRGSQQRPAHLNFKNLGSSIGLAYWWMGRGRGEGHLQPW